MKFAAASIGVLLYWLMPCGEHGCLKMSVFQHMDGTRSLTAHDTSVLDLLTRDSFQNIWQRVTYDAVGEQYLNSLQSDQLIDTLNAQFISTELTILNYCLDSNLQYREERISLVNDVAIPLTKAFNPAHVQMIEISGENLPVCFIYLENKKGSYLAKYRLTAKGWEKIKEKAAQGPLDFSPFLDQKVDVNTDVVWTDHNIMVTSLYGGVISVQPIFIPTSKQIKFLEKLLN